MNIFELTLLLEGNQFKARELQDFLADNAPKDFKVQVLAGSNDLWEQAGKLNEKALLVASKKSGLSLEDWPVLLHQLDRNVRGSAVKMIQNSDFKSHTKIFWPSKKGLALKEIDPKLWDQYADALVRVGADYFPPHTLNKKDSAARPLFCARNTKAQDLRRPIRKALFLDRDGVLIKDAGYNVDPAKIELIMETLEVVKRARSLGYLVVVLTNQSGVARGYFSEGQVDEFHQILGEKLSSHDADVDLWLSSFFHEEQGLGAYKKRSLTRKPAPGLALQALESWPLDFTHSLMIGDKASDDLDIPSLQTLHLQGDYDLSKVSAPVIRSPREALKFL